MRRGAIAVWGGLIATVLGTAPALAAGLTVAAGQEQTLTADVVLTGADSVMAGDASGARCIIHGGGHQILAAMDAAWTGRISIQNCDIDGLGMPAQSQCPMLATCTFSGKAIDTTGGADVTIQGSTFSTSGQISIVVGTDTSISFRNNTIKDDAVVTIVNDSADNSQSAFYTKGGSTGTKVFQGNTIRKALAQFELTGDWLIGGDTPADGNILAGNRTGIFLNRTGAMTVRGNYSHTLGAGWNQVKNLNVPSPGGGPLLVEHNVFIGSGWNTEVNCPGEIRYNLFVNPEERGWVRVWSAGGTKVHHNVLFQTRDNDSHMEEAGFVVLEGDNTSMPGPPNSEVYNNTFDEGGDCNPGNEGAAGLSDVLASLRSNAFVNIRLPTWTGNALVGTGTKGIPDPLPVMLGYADYNLFNNTDKTVMANYNVGVAGKTLRVDPGFAHNDWPPGGAVNAQADPMFQGPIPHALPYDEAHAFDRSVDVCQILAYFRQVYAPGAGSPLIDHGDPQEGPGNDIGAVGAGQDNALDLFGKFCDPAVLQPLTPLAGINTCTKVPVDANNVTGAGGTTVPVNHGFACVCQAAGDAGSATGPLLLLAAVASTVLARRRPRR